MLSILLDRIVLTVVLLKTDEIIAVVLRESKKEALFYRRHAVQALGQIVESMHVDLFETTFQMLQPIFLPKESESDDDQDEKEEGQQLLLLELQEAIVISLGRAFPFNPDSQSKICCPDC